MRLVGSATHGDRDELVGQGLVNAAGGDGRITCGGIFALNNFGANDVSLDYVVLEEVGDRLRSSPTKRSLARLLQEEGTTFMRVRR